MRPVARTDHVTVQELPEETLVYDRDGHRLHCLNRTAALVWKHCDGERDLAALAGVVARALNLPMGEAEAATRLALEQLSRRGLLRELVTRPAAEEDRLTRRMALRRVVVTAAGTLPAVMTLRSPGAAWGSCKDDVPIHTANRGCMGLLDCPPGYDCRIETKQEGRCNSWLISTGTCVKSGRPFQAQRVVPPPVNCIVDCIYDANGNLSLTGSSGCGPGTRCSVTCPPQGAPNSNVHPTGTCV